MYIFREYIYLVSCYIVIVYRRDIECGCVWNCFVCMLWVVILLLCTEMLLNVAVFKTVLYKFSEYLGCYCLQTSYWMWLCFKLYCMYVSSYTVIVYRRGSECGCIKAVFFINIELLYCYFVQNGYWMWLCFKLYCIYFVSCHIVIVYRSFTEWSWRILGISCLWNGILPPFAT